MNTISLHYYPADDQNLTIYILFQLETEDSLAFLFVLKVETALALGATPRQATLQQVKRSLVIALPGAMTGLIMGGASPLEAIQLQIVVMNMLMGASTVSSILSTFLCWPAFFTKAFQLEEKVFAD